MKIQDMTVEIPVEKKDHIDEIINLSDKAIDTITKMLQTQYKMGFEYAIHCINGNYNMNIVQNTEKTLEKILVPMEAEYFRALVKARKGKVEVM